MAEVSLVTDLPDFIVFGMGANKPYKHPLFVKIEFSSINTFSGICAA